LPWDCTKTVPQTTCRVGPLQSPMRGRRVVSAIEVVLLALGTSALAVRGGMELDLCTVTPDPMTVEIGGRAQLTAHGWGGGIEIPASEVTTTWSLEAEGGEVGTITPQGSLHVLSPGRGLVTAAMTHGSATVQCSAALWVPTDPPPAIVIAYPLDEAVLEGGALRVSGTAGFADRVEVRVDDGPWFPATGVTSWSVGVAGLSAGRHRIEARSVGGLGGMSAVYDSVMVTVDTGEGSPSSLGPLPSALLLVLPVLFVLLVALKRRRGKAVLDAAAQEPLRPP